MNNPIIATMTSTNTTTLLNYLSTYIKTKFPSSKVSVLAILDLAVEVASHCLHSSPTNHNPKSVKKTSSSSSSAPPPPQPTLFSQSVIQKLELMRSALKVELNVRRKFDALKSSHSSVLSPSDWDTCWLLYCALLLSASSTVPPADRNPSTSLLTNYKKCVAILAFYMTMRESAKPPKQDDTNTKVVGSPLRRRLQVRIREMRTPPRAPLPLTYFLLHYSPNS
jgi:hypothetical protein